MKKLSKTAKTVIISVAVPLVLIAVVVVLLTVLPKKNSYAGSDVSLNMSLVEEQVVPINTKNANDVNYLSVKNENGSYAFTRNKRVIQQSTESGETENKEDFYWTSEELYEVPQDDSTVRAFISGLAQLSGVSVVEENAEDLSVYGLDEPKATVEAELDDGTKLTMLFGIKNPANEQTVYFRLADSNKVYLVNYYSAANVFTDVRKFAKLTLTEPYSSDKKNELNYLNIIRSDMEDPVVIKYISVDEAKKIDENFELATRNTHRFISPITTEVNSAGRSLGVSGKSLCYGVYDLTMNACESLDKTYETLKKYGLDNPFARVEFKYGGKEYFISFSAEDTERKVYYVEADGVPGIYSISREDAPWCTFTMENLLPVRPVSPYIYSVDNIEITKGEATYKYEIDSVNKTFTCNGISVNADNFREFYLQLIDEIGEETYVTQTSEEQLPEVSVKFTYKDDYSDVYGRDADILEFFPSDGRKCKVNLNGKTLYKVKDDYVTRLIENISALNNGEDVNIEW